MSQRTESDWLKEWKLEAELPATFNAAVWRRIEAKPRPLRLRFEQWLENVFARPRAIVAYGTAAMALGLVIGQLHGSASLRQGERQLEARYVQSVDPYASRPGI